MTMVTLRFKNEAEKALDLMVEPWGAVEAIPSGATFAIHYTAPSDREDTSHVEYHNGMIRFQCEGDAYELEVNGVFLLT